MKKNKGFTLIELLAVIVILGVIMMIAIPSVTGYITSSRKSSFASTGGYIITAVRDYAIMHNGLPTYVGQAIAYRVVDADGNMQVTLESGGKESAFGKAWAKNYNYVIIVANANNNYDYYYTGADKDGNYINLCLENDLDGSKVLKSPVNGDNLTASGLVAWNGTVTGISSITNGLTWSTEVPVA